MDETILEFVIAEYRRALEDAGAPTSIVDGCAQDFEAEVRAKFGGRWQYIPSEDKLVRNRRVLAMWDAALRDNAVRGRPETVKVIRDRICAQAGVSRRTLENLIAGKVAAQHLP